MNIKIFENHKLGSLRALVKNNEVWFVAKDVALALGYATPQRMYNHVAKEDKMKINPQSEEYKGLCKNGTTVQLSKNPNTFILMMINESGLYSAIFNSELSAAKQFKRWVTSEVLPSIRKHGIYATDETIDNILNNPDFGIKLLEKLKSERQARLEAEHTNKILMHHKKLYTTTEIAKELGFTSAIKLNKKMYNDKIQFKQNGTWILYSNYADLGLVHIKQEVLDTGRIIYHRKWTQEGRKFLIEKYSI